MWRQDVSFDVSEKTRVFLIGLATGLFFSLLPMTLFLFFTTWYCIGMSSIVTDGGVYFWMPTAYGLASAVATRVWHRKATAPGTPADGPAWGLWGGLWALTSVILQVIMFFLCWKISGGDQECLFNLIGIYMIAPICFAYGTFVAEMSYKIMKSRSRDRIGRRLGLLYLGLLLLTYLQAQHISHVLQSEDSGAHARSGTAEVRNCCGHHGSQSNETGNADLTAPLIR